MPSAESLLVRVRSGWKDCEFYSTLMPVDKPRYAMGIGNPEDLLMLWENGIDMSDCIIPTKFARGGTLFTSRGK